MPAQVPESVSPTRSGPDTRARILAVANDLFYAHGIRATSADRIIEEVSITKVTFYRHFNTKSQLVVAYLEQQAAAERAGIENVLRPGDPVGSLRAIAFDIGAMSCRPGFRGCAFINAAAEFSDPEDPVRMAVDTHRRWMLATFAVIAAEVGAEDTQAVAKQLMILRDGAMVNGYLNDAASVADSLEAAFESILSTAASASMS